ncbi:MAG TPA: hypothetical protein VMJ12_05360, partial [Candidatus Acidoferrales bacterium]|nr:hypothetical protein [Candidatus Acidoferrales bacterium]
AQLRHSTIQMTASHYTDPRQRAALPVGELLSDYGKEISIDQKPPSKGSARKAGSNRFKAGVKVRV